jgi:hypothetical protein
VYHHRFGWFAVAVGLALPVASAADRRPEARGEATHVVVGRVEGVYAQQGARGANQRHVVEIAIEKVERGDGLKAGQTFYASCYRPNPKAPDLSKLSERQREAFLLTVDGGHNAVPREGERVRVFVIHSGGKYNGVFPDWFDALKEK